jgi:hypothetical protein
MMARPAVDGPVRFGTHARIIADNGWPTIIPVEAGGKKPLVPGWPERGTTPPDRNQLKIWASAYPDANIGFVMDGKTVAIDADIAPENLPEPSTLNAAALARELAGLADDILGKTPFTRVGREPKWMKFFAAADAVPTRAGGPVEVFCTAGSKQVLLHGRHPEGVEYRWTGKASPLTHSWTLLPSVQNAQITEFWRQAIKVSAKMGFWLTKRKRSPAGVQCAPSPREPGEGGIVSELLSELLTLMSQEPDRDRREIAAEFFSRAAHGERHYHLVAAVSALVLWGLSNVEIIDALKDAYAANVPEDRKMVGLIERPASVRDGMTARGAAVFPISDLEQTFGASWSIFR